jgi:hypothetical protein
MLAGIRATVGAFPNQPPICSYQHLLAHLESDPVGPILLPASRTRMHLGSYPRQ